MLTTRRTSSSTRSTTRTTHRRGKPRRNSLSAESWHDVELLMRLTMKWVMPLLFVLCGCAFDQQMISVAAPQMVIHCVLDPNSSIQEVLVELTLTGTVLVNDNVRYDPLDPINSGEGIPVAGASVKIQGPDGTFTGFERKYPGRS